MASISYQLESRSKNPSIRIRIYHNGSSSYINTGVCVDSKFFTGDKLCPISKNCPKFNEIRRQLLSYIGRIEDCIYKFDTSCIRYTSAMIRSEICGDKHNKEQIQRKDTYTGWYERFAEMHLKEKTIRSMLYALKLMQRYSRSELIMWNDIDYSFVKDFELWMRKNGIGEYTMYSTLSYMRAAYKEAERRKMVSHNNNPFIDYSIPRPKLGGDVPYISEKGIKRLQELNLSTLQGGETLERARDIILISFYLCGMNLIDIYNLKQTDADEIVYVRSKIEKDKPRPVHITITPELRELIDKYRGTKYLFNFQENTKGSFDSFQHNLLHRLKRISAYCGESITFALIRHTWGTYACKNGIDFWTIDKSLGHKDNSLSGKYYVSYDWSKTNDANRIVIDYIKEGVVPNSIQLPAYLRDIV